jgi:type IV pilus assembly protein PilC
MGEFRYKAKDRSGKFKEGILKVKSSQSAKQQIARMQLKIVSLEEFDDSGMPVKKKYLGGLIVINSKGDINIQLGDPKPTDKDLIVFTKQLATMLASGVPLNQSLDILSRQQRIEDFGYQIKSIQKALEEGSTFSGALAKYPKTFDTLYVAMAKAGEESGKISDILLKVSIYIEKAAKIKSQVKSAMMYPTFILLVAVLIVSGLLIFVVPTFTEQFANSGKPLPALTQWVKDFSDWLAKNIGKVIVGAVVFVFLFKRWARTPKGEEKVDQMLLKAPLFGELMRKIAVGRFCQTLASMLTSGVNLLPALTICASSAGNVVIERFIASVRLRIESGSQLSQPLSENPIFPPMVVSMVQVGEKAGRLDEMLSKISEFYEEEVDVAVKGLLAMLEPMMIVFIGGVIAVIVVAMYLPIFDIASLVDTNG